MTPTLLSSAARSAPRAAATLMRTIVALAIAACSGGETDADAIVSRRVTVGDTLVVRTTGAMPDMGTHTLDELWRVGDAEGTDSTISFGGINGFSVKTDHTVAVFDFTGPTLRTYDVNGRYVRTIGRKGAGPGEYTQTNGMTYLADGRLAFWDPATARITLYNDDGTVSTEWKPPVTGMWMFDALRAVSTHALAINSTLPDNMTGDAPPVRGPRASAYFLYDSAGIVTDTLMVPLPTEPPPVITAETESMSLTFGVPFAPSALDALRPDGQLAVAFGRDYIIRLSNGARPMRIERESPIVPTTDGERANARETVEYQIRQSMPEWRWNGPALPDVKPVIRDMKATSDNRLWVQVSAPGQAIPDNERDAPRAATPGMPAAPVQAWREPVWYDVYEPSGEFFARIVMPPRSTLLGARGELVWGAVRDVDDVPFLVQWRITPRGPLAVRITRAAAWRTALSQNARVGISALFANPLRTVLSTLGVIIGVASLVAVLSVGDGMEQTMRTQLETTTSLQFFNLMPVTTEDVDGQSFPIDSYPVFSVADARDAQSIEGLEGIHAELSGRAEASDPDSRVRRLVAVTAVSEGWAALAPVPLGAGALLDATDMDATRTSRVVISRELAARFAAADSLPDANAMVGRNIRLEGHQFLIAGVTADSSPEERAWVGLPDVDRALPPSARPRAVLMLGKIARIEEADSVKARVTRWANARFGVGTTTIRSNEGRLAQVAQGVLLFKLFMGAITSISLLVGGIGIMNVLLASVTERTREIGIRKAMGARKRDVLWQFLAESVAVASLGSTLGVVLGLGGAYAITWLMRSQLTGMFIYASVSWSTILIAVISALFVGLVFGTYPARRAARLNPIDAIRHE